MNAGNPTERGSANIAPTTWPTNPQPVQSAATTGSSPLEHLKARCAAHAEQTSEPTFAPSVPRKPPAALPEAKRQYASPAAAPRDMTIAGCAATTESAVSLEHHRRFANSAPIDENPVWSAAKHVSSDAERTTVRHCVGPASNRSSRPAHNALWIGSSMAGSLASPTALTATHCIRPRSATAGAAEKMSISASPCYATAVRPTAKSTCCSRNHSLIRTRGSNSSALLV